MIVSVGADLASVKRVEHLIDRFGGRFLRRVFTDAERAYCDVRPFPCQSYAARFAAKEAVMKCLGTGFGKGVRFASIEISGCSAGGAPSVTLTGPAEELARSLGILRFHISLSHEKDMAMAVAVAEG